MIALAVAAFLVGAVVGAAHRAPSAARTLATSFAQAWTRGDYATMYSEIAPSAQRVVSVSEFADLYREALTTATASGERVAGAPRSGGGDVEVVPVQVRTRLFGTLAEDFRLPVVAEAEAEPRVAWSRSLAFPGLRAGEQLSSRTALPARAALLARDGSVLAEGPASAAGTRSSPLSAAASALVGEVGPIPASSRQALEALGVPASAIVGTSGLELAADERLRGTPGGELLAVPAGSDALSGAGGGAGAGGDDGAEAGGDGAEAGGGEDGARVLASASAHPGEAVRTTISPAVQSAAVGALGGQYGGVVALAPASGEILGVAGIGLDALQPPGSTFKMITASGALEAGIASPRSTFPYQTQATLDGVALHNANGESCGGSLVQAFAVSCNSVFAPLGVKLGAARLVQTAERFGFNRPTGIAGAPESTIPPAARIQGELAVGSTAIGQGEVQASALQMALVAATIADGGRRPVPSLVPRTGGGGAGKVRAISAATARTVRSLMIDVVRFGTGTAAAIPGVVVAGKTGTAELGSPSSCAASSSERRSAEGEESAEERPAEEHSCSAEQSSPQNTDAWFAAFAPALHPRIAVAVLMVRDGAGGATAAPVARQVLEAGLRATAPGAGSG